MPETSLGLSVRDALLGAAATLTEAGCETPRLDAELLLAEALGVDRSRLVIEGQSRLSADVVERLDELIRRREAREPVAYILGRKAFRYLTLAVDPRVLIPRPETELLVEVGLTLPPGARVLDAGTGSGAIALALKDERPDLEVWGSDVSEEALAVARANGFRLGLEVRWLKADLLSRAPGPFDAILANLPYVASDAPLAPEIERYEPVSALRAGADGLEVIRRLVAQARAVPVLALEIGSDQALAVRGLLDGAGFGSVDVLRDLAGHERVVVGRR
ncbi:MAG TPA: peptide chain release factor N(5)-glutamine methyltransferase [Solirubrobacteraceae bacterium]|nr:peptide chain release factor N(5)-glutamine methyltransferase [Solirubrobacteraceae bacterium]